MVTIVQGNSARLGSLMAGAALGIAPLAMEMEVLVDRLESDLRQDGAFSPELAERVHDLRARAERLFT